MKMSLILSIIILSALMFGCSEKNETVNEYEKVLLSASWTYNYESVEELSKSSDLIAIVKVKGMKNDDTYSAYAVKLTIYDVEIKQLIYGEYEGDIKVVMTGGIDEAEKKIYEIADDPLMMENEEFLIFANQNKDGTYTILSGPQGRFEIKNERIYSLNISNEQVKNNNHDSNVKVYGEEKEDFIKKIKENVK